MKSFWLTLLFSINVFTQPTVTESVAYDNDGFATCYQANGNYYFFDWDHYVHTPQKEVQYFTAKNYTQSTGHFIRNCKDQRFLKEIPSEILRPIDNLKDILPEQVQFSLTQVSEGAHLFRVEKTATEYISNHGQTFKADQPEVLSQLRYDVGDSFASEVMTAFSNKFLNSEKSCETLVGTCDFYLCQEAKNPCGLDSYNLSFGYKYCSGSKFKLLSQMKTEAGKFWVNEVFRCLQKINLENSATFDKSQNVCSSIKDTSYDSHPDCYVKAGFCHLNALEKIRIFNLIKKEIFSAETITQGQELIKQCGDHQ